MEIVATVCYLVRNTKHGKEVLLGLKLRGIGVGFWNGLGGKNEITDRSLKQTAAREIEEEAKVRVKEEDLIEKAVFKYHFLPPKEALWIVHHYIAEVWRGNPRETEEMMPCWFPFDKIPFEKMWTDSQYFLLRILNGETVHGEATFQGNEMLYIKIYPDL